MGGLSVLTGLDPAAVLLSARIDAPQIVAEEIERVQHELHVVRRVWVFGYAHGTRVVDTMIEGSVAHLDGASMLMMRDDWQEVDAARVAWGDQLDLAWMPIGHPVPIPVPTVSYLVSAPADMPNSDVGAALFVGAVILWIVMLLSLR